MKSLIRYFEDDPIKALEACFSTIGLNYNKFIKGIKNNNNDNVNDVNNNDNNDINN